MKKPGDDLIQAIKDDPRVIRFKQLEEKIEMHPTIYKAYEDLKLAQQQYVRANAQQSSKAPALKDIYDTQKKALLENPWIAEYLDLMEDINADLQWMVKTIETSLNIPPKETIEE